ncbi:unnamed protein product, partial [Prorocentrum cordatum]
APPVGISSQALPGRRCPLPHNRHLHGREGGAARRPRPVPVPRRPRRAARGPRPRGLGGGPPGGGRGRSRGPLRVPGGGPEARCVRGGPRAPARAGARRPGPAVPVPAAAPHRLRDGPVRPRHRRRVRDLRRAVRAPPQPLHAEPALARVAARARLRPEAVGRVRRGGHLRLCPRPLEQDGVLRRLERGDRLGEVDEEQDVRRERPRVPGLRAENYPRRQGALQLHGQHLGSGERRVSTNMDTRRVD